MEKVLAELTEKALFGVWAFEMAQALMEKLIEKGLLTEEEADEVFEVAKNEAQVKTLGEVIDGADA